ncbi:MAG: Maf family protein [Ilumatobacteraceae bacterium]
MADPALVLASGSPRRREMLSGLGLDFRVDPADVDESAADGESPIAYVRRIASSKATTVAARHPSAVVLAADTTIDLDGEILAKPVDADEAVGRNMEAGASTNSVMVLVMRRASQYLALKALTA